LTHACCFAASTLIKSGKSSTPKAECHIGVRVWPGVAGDHGAVLVGVANIELSAVHAPIVCLEQVMFDGGEGGELFALGFGGFLPAGGHRSGGRGGSSRNICELGEKVFLLPLVSSPHCVGGVYQLLHVVILNAQVIITFLDLKGLGSELHG
jgi:hypothetical protein